MRKVLLAALMAILVACTPQQHSTPGEAIVPEFNRSGEIMQVQVVVHPTLKQVQHTLDTFHGTPQPAVYGWSAWSLKGIPHQCEIHVATPGVVDDAMIKTWGHELAHCIYGSYHK